MGGRRADGEQRFVMPLIFLAIALLNEEQSARMLNLLEFGYA